MLTWVGVAFFGALGAVARFRVDSAVSARLPSDFPLGTLVVNLSGSFALGALVGASVSHRVAFLLGTGFTGGYTTFSTWMLDTRGLLAAGEPARAAAYVLGTLVVGLVAVFAGTVLGRGWIMVARRRRTRHREGA